MNTCHANSLTGAGFYLDSGSRRAGRRGEIRGQSTFYARFRTSAFKSKKVYFPRNYPGDHLGPGVAVQRIADPVTACIHPPGYASNRRVVEQLQGVRLFL